MQKKSMRKLTNVEDENHQFAIRTEDLTKSYKELLAVDRLNLAIKQGELFTLLGLNGAGKTTTIKMLSCLLSPSSGDALLLGKSICHNCQEIKQIINLSPQETAVAENLSVKENLELCARIYGASKEEAAIKSQEMMKLLSLTEVSHRRSKVLSGGMQRRLSIAMGLISDPKILFLDEPTLGLDVIARRELWNMIRALKGKITIILTTHYMEEAAALSDRIGILAKGQLKQVGTVVELLRSTQTESLEDAFISVSSMEGLA